MSKTHYEGSGRKKSNMPSSSIKQNDKHNLPELKKENVK